ncbi:MAG: hypothetical protein IJD48_01375, partial [Clostridia bacterium]|nr:hypothetical protein [Clostridia bacterium]
NVEICAKTGTVGCTNSAYKENTDAWNLSYTPDISMCVWVGSTNKTNLLNKKITGGSIPTQIAQSIYSKNKFKNKKFTIPNDVKICEINDFEYINDNKINLCSNNTPERYRRKEYFSLSNQPKTESTMFIDIDKPQISLNECNRSKIEIKLNAKKHLAYNLYKYLDGTRIHVASTSNKQGQTILTDKNVISNKVVKYYVEAKINNCNKEKDINGIENFYCKSNEIDLYVA